MKDTLPKSGPRKNEYAIVNLDNINGAGTHWVAYRKTNSVTNYFDSFGDLPPPLELHTYLRAGASPTKKILYNVDRQQNFNSVVCGHLCLQFLASKHGSSKY